MSPLGIGGHVHFIPYNKSSVPETVPWMFPYVNWTHCFEDSSLSNGSGVNLSHVFQPYMHLLSELTSPREKLDTCIPLLETQIQNISERSRTKPESIFTLSLFPVCISFLSPLFPLLLYFWGRSFFASRVLVFFYPIVWSCLKIIMHAWNKTRT